MTDAERDFISSLIGRPYQLGANGPDAFDCYGLARHVQRVVMGFDLPDASRAGSIVTAIRDNSEHRRWHRVEKPEAYDVVLMANVIDRSTHMGVWIKPSIKGAVLHAWQKVGVCMHDVPTLRAIAFGELRFYRRKSA